MISLNRDARDRLAGRKCTRCKGVGDGKWFECDDCNGTGWAVEPIRVEVCVNCGGTGGDAEYFKEGCPTCAGTGERWPDVMFENVFGELSAGTVLEYKSQRLELTAPASNDQLAHIFTAVALYGGRVFFRVESEASARAFAKFVRAA